LPFGQRQEAASTETGARDPSFFRAQINSIQLLQMLAIGSFQVLCIFVFSTTAETLDTTSVLRATLPSGSVL
jgi:hypothetical protein